MLQQTLSVTQVATTLGLKPKTIREWIRKGLLPANKVGKQYFISERSFHAVVSQADSGYRMKNSAAGLVHVPSAKRLDLMTREQRVEELAGILTIDTSSASILATRRQRDSRRREQLGRCKQCQ